MDPYFNGQSPAAPGYAQAASSFSVPVPVFPTSSQQLPQQQQQQVGELQQTASAYMPPFQTQSYPAQNSSTPTHPPPYNQMITEAIAALKEREGSSRQAIAKYIERFFPNLPSGHAHLLTQHLKRMKDSGQLVMLKHSYLLPGSAPEVLADLPVSSVPKRSPGRPPKLKPVMNSNTVQQQQGQFQQGPPGNEANVQGSYAVPESVFAAIGLVDGVVEQGEPLPKRRPGRPPKKASPSFPDDASTEQNVTVEPVVTEVAAPPSGSGDPTLKRRRGRPFKNGSGARPVAVPVTTTTPGRGRGRPKLNAGVVYSGKPRGRPRRNLESPTPLNAVSGETGGAEEVPANHAGEAEAVPTVSKRGRPGRPPKRFMNEPITKTRQVSGKPVGRPKQNAPATPAQEPATTAHVSNLQQLLAYQELRTKLELFQSRIKHTVGILKPIIEENNETPSNANEALQELEELSALDITAASSLHGMTLLPPEGGQD